MLQSHWIGEFHKNNALNKLRSWLQTTTHPLLVIAGHRWSSLVIAGHCWSLLVIAGHCWSLLVIAGHCWSLLVIAGHCWSLLVITGHCWSLLVIAGHCSLPEKKLRKKTKKLSVAKEVTPSI
ncbi:hypothetical protein HELRODRAFT_159109 [Helobdella robusta]|uniref:Uncharacterized protein n=1 Tax=Helobdella robusta TaxID=6412 RepID=T1ENL8_HELRO|nr:hypothetical protein HELRODRAFT_159109 [Helobdella robusta]ESO12550.1 hypothetical protein HELRODRAFT_159109 [Helobdella robusta]